MVSLSAGVEASHWASIFLLDLCQIVKRTRINKNKEIPKYSISPPLDPIDKTILFRRTNKQCCSEHKTKQNKATKMSGRFIKTLAMPRSPSLILTTHVDCVSHHSEWPWVPSAHPELRCVFFLSFNKWLMGIAVHSLECSTGWLILILQLFAPAHRLQFPCSNFYSLQWYWKLWGCFNEKTSIHTIIIYKLIY